MSAWLGQVALAIAAERSIGDASVVAVGSTGPAVVLAGTRLTHHALRTRCSRLRSAESAVTRSPLTVGVLAAIRAEGDAKFARLMRSSVFERDVADARTWLIEAR